jgi:Secretion system C-terminal sorting domain
MVFFSVTVAHAQSRLPGFPDNTSGPTVHFYPNPANSFITFDDFSKKYDRSYSIQIFNFCGKKVFEFNLGDQKNMVNLSDFFRGIYIFQLRDPNGKIVESGKFQVNK